MKPIQLAAALSLLATLSSQAAIVITGVMSSSAHPASSTSNDDWFELTNTGTTAVDVSGWSWDDSSNSPGSAPFGALLTTIGAGESVILTGEAIGTEAGWLTSWGNPTVRVFAYGGTTFQGLGSGGDTIFIYDQSNALVTSVTFSTATQGFSFEWDGSGNSLGLSVLGENGAYRASTDGSTVVTGAGLDIASPGFAVIPEPSAALLLGVAGLGAFIRRRK
jgi:hypothetical protein